MLTSCGFKYVFVSPIYTVVTSCFKDTLFNLADICPQLTSQGLWRNIIVIKLYIYGAHLERAVTEFYKLATQNTSA